MNKRRMMLVFGAIVSLAFLVLAFNGLDWSAFFAAIQQVEVLWLLPALAVYGLVVLLMGLRERILLRSIAPLSLLPLTVVHTITMMGNNVYPMSGGEALRVYLLKRKFDIPIPTSTTNVIVARLLDGLILLAFVLLALAALDVPPEAFITLALLAAPLFLGLAAFLALITIYPGLLRWAIARLCRRLPERWSVVIAHTGEQIIASLAVLRHPGTLAGLVLVTALMRLTEACVYWLVMESFALGQTFAVAVLTMSIVNLAGVVSASPGQIGVNQFAIGLVLTTLGLLRDTAMAYAIVVHMVMFVPMTLAGVVLLAQEGLSWRHIAQAQETQEMDILRTREVAALQNPFLTQEMPVINPQDVQT